MSTFKVADVVKANTPLPESTYIDSVLAVSKTEDDKLESYSRHLEQQPTLVGSADPDNFYYCEEISPQ